MEQKEQIRVLQIVTQMACGGLETMLMNYDRNIDHHCVQFDFLEHRDILTDYDPEIQQLGGRIYRIKRLNPFDPRYLRELDRFFQEHPEYQIVHAHLDCLSGIPLKYAKKNGVPVRIAHAHSTGEIKNIKYPVKMLFKHTASKYATDCIACGKEAGEWMFGGRQFSLLKNAIDAEKFSYDPTVREEMRSQLGISGGTLVVGHVGGFGFPKNHTFLVDIFDALRKIRQDSKLLLVGDGSRENEIKQKCRDLGLEKQVIFTGLRTDVDRLIQAMDVFVFPSHYEGLGRVGIEAQASGLPCIFSDRIPSECIITEGLVKQMSLQENADTWAKEVLASAGTGRQITLQQIRKSGFDIKENAAALESFYMEKWKDVRRSIEKR